LKARSCPICEICGSIKFSVIAQYEDEILLECKGCGRTVSFKGH
jgi:translation initiation factor 2 beta subunit (eIF-2beta)/eIF-5